MCRSSGKTGGVTSLKDLGSSPWGEVLTFLMKTPPQPALTRLHSSQRAPVSHKPDHDASAVSISPVAFHLVQSRSLRHYEGPQGSCLIWPHHLSASLCSQRPLAQDTPVIQNRLSFLEHIWQLSFSTCKAALINTMLSCIACPLFFFRFVWMTPAQWGPTWPGYWKQKSESPCPPYILFSIALITIWHVCFIFFVTALPH